MLTSQTLIISVLLHLRVAICKVHERDDKKRQRTSSLEEIDSSERNVHRRCISGICDRDARCDTK